MLGCELTVILFRKRINGKSKTKEYLGIIKLEEEYVIALKEAMGYDFVAK